MTQTPVPPPHPVAPDHSNTLVLAIELSNKSWVLAAQVPGLTRVKAKQTIEPTAEALLAALQGYRERAKAAGRPVERVIATYEAGWSGFWLARFLATHGVETHVVQPSSVLVGRQACATMRERPLARHLAGRVKQAGLVPLRAPVDAGEPTCRFICHDPCSPMSHGPPRRSPIPVLALKGATSYWAFVVAISPEHMSHLGAQGTRWTVVAPGELARLVSL